MKMADYMIPWNDMRRLRADALTAHVMRIISPYITDYENNLHAKAHEALYKVFHDAGVEVITDMDRAAAGLMPRDDQGYTRDELQILEMRRREAMMRPLPVSISLIKE